MRGPADAAPLGGGGSRPPSAPAAATEAADSRRVGGLWARHSARVGVTWAATHAGRRVGARAPKAAPPVRGSGAFDVRLSGSGARHPSVGVRPSYLWPSARVPVELVAPVLLAR